METQAINLNRGQRTILIIAAVCLLPLAAALMFRFVWTPPTKPSLGELISPQPFPFASLQTLEGRPFPHAEVSETWLIAYAAPGQCDPRCQQSLYLTRQSRAAQGKGSMRVERLWVITDEAVPARELIAAHPDLILARLAPGASLPQLGGAGTGPRNVYLVDRRGQMVMRYSDDPEPMAFIKEVGRLIKF